MTIEYDSESKSSTHLESGLTVKWLRDDPPMERRSFFALIADGAEIPFEAYYDFGNDAPQTLPTERKTRFRDVSEKNFKTSNIAGRFDRQIFVNVWQNLVSQGFSSIQVSACYTERGSTEWRATT